MFHRQAVNISTLSRSLAAMSVQDGRNGVKNGLEFQVSDTTHKRHLSADNSSQLPVLTVFIGQAIDPKNELHTDWTPITFASSCTFASVTSFTCEVQFRNVQRLNSSLPAVLVVSIEPKTDLLEITAVCFVQE